MTSRPGLRHDDVFRLRISDSERNGLTLGPDRLRPLVEALRSDGIVVLENAVSQASIDVLRARLIADVEHILARPDAPFNWTKGNIQQAPPPFPPYLFRDVLVNDFAIAVTKSILGRGMKCGFYSGNTALPSENRQPVHADEGQLWPDLIAAPPAHALVVNVPLVDMGPENGSTEVWPGTHLDTEVVKQNGDIEVPSSSLHAWREKRPPFQPTVSAGSIVIRDIRMWHAGMPNRSSAPRPMIAMIHSIAWMPTEVASFGSGSEPFLSHPDLEWRYSIHRGPIDHIGASQGFKMQEAL